MSYGLMQGIGGQAREPSPAEVAEQQKRWEKERVENEARAYESQLAHAALMLLTGAGGARFDAQSALKMAHDVFQGAKALTR